MSKVVITEYQKKILFLLLDENRRFQKVMVYKGQEEKLPIGTIAIGIVTKIVRDAAFISFGTGTDYYLKISEKMHAANAPRLIKVGDRMLLQISGEAVKSKQPTCTDHISIAGKYVILEKSTPGLSFSSKIPSKTVKELKADQNLSGIMQRLAQSYHVILRTDCNNCIDSDIPFAPVRNDIPLIWEEAQELERELQYLYEIADSRTPYSIIKAGRSREELFFDELNLDQIEEIITDLDFCQDKLQRISENRNIPFHFYSDPVLSLANLYRLPAQIEELSGKKVWLPSGGFLVIEQGETLTAIDVNSGKNISKNTNHDEFCHNLNVEASNEIARQLILRNISGIVIIDFLKYGKKTYHADLILAMKELVKYDKITCKVVDITGLGLMELTRAKKYQSFLEAWGS